VQHEFYDCLGSENQESVISQSMVWEIRNSHQDVCLSVCFVCLFCLSFIIVSYSKLKFVTWRQHLYDVVVSIAGHWLVKKKMGSLPARVYLKGLSSFISSLWRLLSWYNLTLWVERDLIHPLIRSCYMKRCTEYISPPIRISTGIKGDNPLKLNSLN